MKLTAYRCALYGAVWLLLQSNGLFGFGDYYSLNFGPMVHYNFGGEGNCASFGMELSFWDFSYIPLGVDLGVDFDRNSTRVYAEMQASILFAGVSIGPVVAMKGPGSIMGIQGSLWGAYPLILDNEGGIAAGLNLRMRRVDKQGYFAPGTFVKFLTVNDMPRM